MREDLLKRVAENMENNTHLCGQPASDQEIRNAEAILSVKFSDQYIEFIKRFGGAYVGINIRAFNNGFMVGKETVIDATLRFRRDFHDELDSELEKMYVLSGDGCGNPFLMDQHGAIYIFYHDSGERELVYGSLEDLLEETFPEGLKWPKF
jgi:hypothetical protein